MLVLDMTTDDPPATLWAFNGYGHTALGMTLKEAVNEPKRKLGHAFVLAWLLENLK